MNNEAIHKLMSLNKKINSIMVNAAQRNSNEFTKEEMLEMLEIDIAIARVVREAFIKNIG